jgi:uncharacterized protein (DUF305 family)
VRTALVVLPFAVVLALVGGCTQAPKTATAAPAAPVLAPGKPGEQARTLGPGEAATAIPSAAPNATDVRFMQDMVVHHRQALEMSRLAPARAESADLKLLASRIDDVQGPEINMMIGWLQQQGQKVPEHHISHGTMPGMATPEQLAELKAATGTGFDRLFIQLMTAHHKGAITMSGEVLVKGSEAKVQEIAEDISVTQTAEVYRMARLPAAG